MIYFSSNEYNDFSLIIMSGNILYILYFYVMIFLYEI